MIEQRDVVRGADVQPELGLEAELARARRARRARHQHERVADHPAERMARAAGHRGGDEAVRRALEQRHLLAGGGAQRLGVELAPVVVDQRASAQVADAGAAPAQEAAEHPRLGEPAEPEGRVVHRLLERRAHVRRAERDDLADAVDPGVAVELRDVRGAAGHQPAHRVADERDLLDLDRPCVDGGLEQLGQRAAVLGDVAAAVVADVDGRDAEVAGELRAVVLAPSEMPAALGLHEPVEEDDEPRSGGREGRGQLGALRRHGQAVDADRHRLRQRAAVALEAVADEAVEDRDAEAAVRGGRQRPLGPRAATDDHLGAATGGACRPAERADDTAGDRVVDELDRRPCRHEAERARRDVALHRPHALGQAAELLEAEAHERAGLVVCLPDQLCHGSMYLHIG